MWNDFWIGVVNFIIKNVMSDDYSDKLHLLIQQGLYHADNGNGPYIITKD